MFIDYYILLEVSENATSDEIKEAFRREVKKYHDDTNMGEGNKERTRLLIAAKLILLDIEARQKYDEEYRRYCRYKAFMNERNSQISNTDYEIQDEQLYKWMQNAKKQAQEMYEEVIEEFKESAKASSKGILSFLIYILPFLVGYLLFKMCSRL